MKTTASCCVDWCSGVDLAPSNRRAWQDSGISAGAVDEIDLARGAMVRGFDLQNLALLLGKLPLARPSSLHISDTKATDCFQLVGIGSKRLNCLQYRSQVVTSSIPMKSGPGIRKPGLPSSGPSLRLTVVGLL